MPHFWRPSAGVRGRITRYLISIPTAAVIYHFFELDVDRQEADWPERLQRMREWVDYGEAILRVQWKEELAYALRLSSVAPRR